MTRPTVVINKNTNINDVIECYACTVFNRYSYNTDIIDNTFEKAQNMGN